MIITNLTNSNPYTGVGASTFIVSPVISRVDFVEEFDNFCICDYDCDYEEIVFADLSDSADHKNDTTSLLFQISLPTDTVTLKMFKDGVEIATITDDTYGTYFAPADFPDGLKYGFIVDWNKVLTLEGVGLYHFQADTSIISQANTTVTHKYRLYPFDEQIANGTVVITVKSGGVIEGGIEYADCENIDFTWSQSVRIKGKLWNQQPKLETDNYLDTDRRLNQIQDQITTTYELETGLLPSTIAKPLIYDRLLANEIFITDYNLFNFCIYRSLAVYPDEITDARYFNKTNNGLFKIRFKDRKENIIKRRFL